MGTRMVAPEIPVKGNTMVHSGPNREQKIMNTGPFTHPRAGSIERAILFLWGTVNCIKRE